MLSIQRSFSVDPAVLTRGHPYAVAPSSRSCTIHFVEFRGMGPPSADFGAAGDVYVDVNPRGHSLYWRERDITRGFGAGQWTRWTALLLDKVPLHKFLVPHPWAANPEASDLYLWVDPAGVKWTSKDELCASRVQMVQRNIARGAPGATPDVDALVSEVLQRMLDRERSVVSGPRGGGFSQTGRSSTPTPTSQRRSSIEHPPGASSSSSSHDVRHRPTYHHSPTLLPIHPQRDAGEYTRPRTSHESFRQDLFRRGSSGGMGPPPNTYLHPMVPGNPYSPPMPAMQHDSEQDNRRRAEKALEDMRRAQYAETKSKQELKQKNRELAQLRKKEKEVIGMSYIYQKREQDLVAALAAAQQRSSAELEQMRAAVYALNRQAEAAQEQSRAAAAQVQRSEEELAATQREVKNLQSQMASKGYEKNAKSSAG
ncbi:hypothetical protein B0H17DRAFT_1046270 [Mycena rosella]|uniref:Uncharacterized protein n=1 Tax=Mycena rosella TaxID=1033263 RepID=A0AAD7DXM7_MYCRO|nr:hypothetical protein B0H17DRAFT_1046270 [Mycena rosella]